MDVMNHGVSICLIFLLTSGAQSLDQDSILTKYYDAKEIQQMQTVLHFFDTYVIENCQDSKDTSVCYQQYFDRLSASDSLDIEIPFEEQRTLYLKKITPALFHDIWVYSPGQRRMKDGSLQYYNAIDYNPSGKYRAFLEDVAKAEPYFKKYVEPITTAGDLSPSLYRGFAFDPNGLDFNDERHRLILAIHFLTVNDRLATQPK